MKLPLPEWQECPMVCQSCGWSGIGSELIAQACPVCDGRVRELPPPDDDDDTLSGPASTAPST